MSFAQNFDIISGYFIPKGWKVISWIRAIHMDPEYYENPEEFNPSRWDVSRVRIIFLIVGRTSQSFMLGISE